MSVDQLVIGRFLTLYGAPTTNDFAAFADEYRRAIGNPDAGVLLEAVDRVVRRHTYARLWPTVGVVLEAVHAVASERRHLQRPAPVEQWPAPSAEAKARVAALVAGAVARLTELDRQAQRHVSAADLARGARSAWDHRVATSETARRLAKG
jgi:hypothetical protein